MATLPPFLRAAGQGSELLVHVVPGGSRDEIGGLHGERLKVRLAAAPQKGRANKALVLFIAALLKCPASKIDLIRGSSSRQKTLQIDLNIHKVASALEELIPRD
jgi:uncharacterized protein